MTYKEPHPRFFTATILYWRQLLRDDAMKQIILDSLKFLSDQGTVRVFGFVIMPNHIHIVWQINEQFKPEKVQANFLRFTAQQFKFALLDAHSPELRKYYVGAKDREYQFWERNSWSTKLLGESMLLEKLRYIHRNPMQEQWKLVTRKEEYLYSSARFYLEAIHDFGFLEHYKDV